MRSESGNLTPELPLLHYTMLPLTVTDLLSVLRATLTIPIPLPPLTMCLVRAKYLAYHLQVGLPDKI